MLTIACQARFSEGHAAGMAAGKKNSNARNPNTLRPEETVRFRALLEGIYNAHDENGAEVGRQLEISGSAVSQILAEKVVVSIDTCRRIAGKLGKSLYLGVAGEEPPEGMRTVGSDPTSAAAMGVAAREFELPSWAVANVMRTPIPDGWPSLTPAVCHDLAEAWMKWEGKLGSRTRLKVEVKP